jgi:hypothetical protein
MFATTTTTTMNGHTEQKARRGCHVTTTGTPNNKNEDGRKEKKRQR